MSTEHCLQVIARIHSDFPTKFGVPRQSGLIEELSASIIFEPQYRNFEAIRGLEAFSHIWLIWQFSHARRESWSPTVRPPRLGGNTRMGVFATRSPFRPNPLGLSSVRLMHIEEHPQLGPVLHIAGADLVDGTPIYDIKPYLSRFDSHPEATGGFTDGLTEVVLAVDFPPHLLALIPPERQQALLSVLAHDPRPAYQDDPQRRYGLAFAGMDVGFTIQDQTLTVHSVQPFKDGGKI